MSEPNDMTPEEADAAYDAAPSDPISDDEAESLVAMVMARKELQTPEQMLERWNEWNAIQCSCDPDVGHLCEACHDMDVMRNLINEKAELIDKLRKLYDFSEAEPEGRTYHKESIEARREAADLLRKHGG